MDQLRIYFHFRSPYSRLGLHAVAQAGLEQKAETRIIPFTRPAGGAVFLNPTDSAPKRRYMIEDAPRMTARAGLPFALPRPMDPDFSVSLAAFYAARAEGRGLAFALAVSDARWGEGQDISDPELINKIAADGGVTGDLTKAPDPAEVAEDETLADNDGMFGVPFAALEQDGQKRQKFWGQDRFALLVEALA